MTTISAEQPVKQFAWLFVYAFFFVGFLPFLLQKCNVFYTVFQANEIRTVMFLRFLFSVVEKLDFYTHKALFINLV